MLMYHKSQKFIHVLIYLSTFNQIVVEKIYAIQYGSVSFLNQQITSDSELYFMVP